MNPEPKKLSYSNSALQTYRLCGLKYRLHYEAKLVPRAMASAHDLNYGAAWAKGMEVYYKGSGDVEGAMLAFARAYPQSQYPVELPRNSQGKTFANGIAAFPAYHEKWKDDNANWEILEVEKLENADDDDLQTVKLDLVVRDKRDEQVYGCDQKSTGSYLDNRYWQRYEPSSQIRTYATHLKRKYGSYGGFYIDAASFKHRSKAVTPNKGPNKGIYLPAGDWHEFARMMYNPNSACLELERENFEYWTRRIESDRESGIWGYNDQACHQYGNDCQYLPTCSNGWSWPRDQQLILSNYRQQCPTVMGEGRCQLDLDHDGTHDPTVPVGMDNEIEMDDEVEDAAV